MILNINYLYALVYFIKVRIKIRNKSLIHTLIKTKNNDPGKIFILFNCLYEKHHFLISPGLSGVLDIESLICVSASIFFIR